MVRSRIWIALSSLAFVLVALGGIYASPLRSAAAQFQLPKTTPAVALPHDPVAQGPYTVKGNTVVDATGKPYLFHGVGRDGLEYNCWGDGHFTPQELAAMGPGTNTTTTTYWGANTVRLPLSENIWLNGQPAQQCPAGQYQALVKTTVDTLTSMKMNVILDLQWSDAGGQSTLGGGAWAMPDADSVTFWQQVASIYKGYPNVLFEVFNEPHPGTWSCWAGPCKITNDQTFSNDCSCMKTVSYASVGMQALINAIQGTGANNLLVVAGMNWGYDLSQIEQFPLKGTNIVYDTHPYPYAGKQASTWDAAFGTMSTRHAVISAESGEYDCGTTYMSQLLAYFDSHRIGWLGWSWVIQGDACGYPQLISDYQGTPASPMGQLIYQRLRSY